MIEINPFEHSGNASVEKQHEVRKMRRLFALFEKEPAKCPFVASQTGGKIVSAD